MTKREVEATFTHFTLDLPFVKSEFEALKKLGNYEKLEDNIYRWTFPFIKWQQVEVIVNKPLQLNKDFVMKHILKKCEVLYQDLLMEAGKYGRSGITIAKEEDGYVLIEYRKGKEQRHYVTKSYLKFIWDEVFSKIKDTEWIESKKCWEKIVKALELHHWDYPLFRDEAEEKEFREKVKRGWKHEKSGNFNHSYFNGSRRAYMNLAYYPMKALHCMGLIEYPDFSKLVRRIASKDEFDMQEKFTNIMIAEMEAEIEQLLPPIEKRQDITEWAKQIS